MSHSEQIYGLADQGISQNTAVSDFRLQDLDDPIIPATPDTSGVQAIAVGIVLLVFLPVAVDTNMNS